MAILKRTMILTGIAVMMIPAVVHIVWPPSAVCLVFCGAFLIWSGVILE